MSSNQSIIEVKHNATSEQLEQILDILGSGFSVGRAFFQERIQRDPNYDPANTWFATVDQVIASSVQIFPMRLRLEHNILRVAGMGSVCTHEDYQGKGLATRILNGQSIWMKEQGYHLSMLLASKHSFYMRSGWNLLPETIYQLPNAEFVDHVANKQTTDCLTSDAESGDYVITSFSPEHLNKMSQLYDVFNENRTGSYVRDDTYWHSLIQWPTWREAECLLLWQQEKLIAYGIIAHTRDEGAILREFIYNPHDEVDVLPLFTALCKLRANARSITAKLPYDHRLLKFFQDNGAASHPLNIAMWKILNCKALFTDLLPLLQERLLEHSKSTSRNVQLSLLTEHDEICFKLNPSGLQIDVSTAPKHDTVNSEAIDEGNNHSQQPNNQQISLKVSEITLIKWLLYGYDASDEKTVNDANSERSGTAHSGTVEAHYQLDVESVLAALFPQQHYAFYITDYY